MPDFSRWGANGGDPSLNAIARTDRYLDALASEQPVYATDPADAELANLMAGWRDEVRRPPATGVATQRDAEIVLQRAVGARRRTRMSMAVLGSVAASLLCLGGFGAVVYGAGPGDALYGLRTCPVRRAAADAHRSGGARRADSCTEVQQLIDEGHWDAAQDKLQTLTTTVATVDDAEQKQELVTQWKDLTVKVDAKDPNATVPPGVPPPVMPEPAVVAPGSPRRQPRRRRRAARRRHRRRPPARRSSSSETTSSPTASRPRRARQLLPPPVGTPMTSPTTADGRRSRRPRPATRRPPTPKPRRRRPPSHADRWPERPSQPAAERACAGGSRPSTRPGGACAEALVCAGGAACTGDPAACARAAPRPRRPSACAGGAAAGGQPDDDCPDSGAEARKPRD